jgi:hypothetical protein
VEKDWQIQILADLERFIHARISGLEEQIDF